MTVVPSIPLNTGATIPQLGFGTFKVGQAVAQELLETAFEVGHRHIDTATIYGNEAEVGAAIAASGIAREELFVTTKLWDDRHRANDVHGGIEHSLESLGLDYVDLYLIHWPLPMHRLYVDVWKGMEEVHAEGLARAVGTSNFTIEHLKDVLAAASVVPAVNQSETHPLFAQPDLRAFQDEHGIVHESWGPLGQNRYPLDSLPAVVAAAAAHGRTAAQIILRWHVQSNLVVVPKASSREHMQANFDIFDFELTPAEMAAIDALDAGVRLAEDPYTFDD